MRHFKIGFGQHFATALPVDPHPLWVEMDEGDDGKCDWCRTRDASEFDVVYEGQDGATARGSLFFGETR